MSANSLDATASGPCNWALRGVYSAWGQATCVLTVPGLGVLHHTATPEKAILKLGSGVFSSKVTPYAPPRPMSQAGWGMI